MHSQAVTHLCRALDQLVHAFTHMLWQRLLQTWAPCSSLLPDKDFRQRLWRWQLLDRIIIMRLLLFRVPEAQLLFQALHQGLQLGLTFNTTRNTSDTRARAPVGNSTQITSFYVQQGGSLDASQFGCITHLELFCLLLQAVLRLLWCHCWLVCC